MRALPTLASELTEVLGDEGARRFLDHIARLHRLQSGLARTFALDPAKSLTADNSLFGLTSGEVGLRAQWTPSVHEETGLDNLAPYFVSEAEAEAARARLKARQTTTIVVPLPGAWVLVRAEDAFGDREAAVKAAAVSASHGRPMAVVAHEGGYVLVDGRFAYDKG